MKNQFSPSIDTLNTPEALIKTILFPTDFSDAANNAFAYALSMAETLEAEVVLFHAFHPSRVDLELIPTGIYEELAKEEFEEAVVQLKSFEEEFQHRLRKNVPVSHKITHGFAKDQILKIADEIQPDFIVMGTSGANHFIDKLLGSVTSAVIAKADCPVLAIPKEATFRKITQVVYATNFEEEQMEVFEELLSFTHKLDAKLTCVHIKKENKEWDLLQLDTFVKLYREKITSGELEFYLHHDEDIYQGLQGFMEFKQVDILAISPQKKRIFERLFTGSLTRKMAFHSEVPLLTFRKRTLQHIA